MRQQTRPAQGHEARPGARPVLGVDVGRKNLALCLLRPGDCPRGTQDAIERWAVPSILTTVAYSDQRSPAVGTCPEVAAYTFFHGPGAA